MRRLRSASSRCLPIVLALLLLACDKNQTTAYRERLLVTATLQPGLPAQYVVIDRTYRADDSVSSIGIHGPVVRLWHENSPDTAQLETCTVERGLYPPISEYRTPPGFVVQPGSTYGLHVSWRDEQEGRTFDGEDATTVPGPITFTRPLAGDTLNTDSTILVTFRRSLNAAGYNVYARVYLAGEAPFVYTLYGYSGQEETAYADRIPNSDSMNGYAFVCVHALNPRLYWLAFESPGDTIGEDVVSTFGALSAESVKVYLGP